MRKRRINIEMEAVTICSIYTYKCIAIIQHSSSVFDLLALLILLLLMTILPHLTHSAASYDYRIKRLYNNLRRGVCNELLYLSVIISLVSVPMP